TLSAADSTHGLRPNIRWRKNPKPRDARRFSESVNPQSADSIHRGVPLPRGIYRFQPCDVMSADDVSARRHSFRNKFSRGMQFGIHAIMRGIVERCNWRIDRMFYASLLHVCSGLLQILSPVYIGIIE